MKKKVKKIINSLAVAGVLASGSATVAHAASFGSSVSGASSVESFNVKYDGAAWNYSNSPFRSTYFTYTRDERTLMNKVAYSGKVTGSVWDDLMWGEKYTTKFKWNRGARK